MNADFFNALDLLEKENGISKEYMISQIELALANACRKEVGPTTVIRVQLDPNKKDMRVFQQRTVVPDGEVYDENCEIGADCVVGRTKSMSDDVTVVGAGLKLPEGSNVPGGVMVNKAWLEQNK